VKIVGKANVLGSPEAIERYGRDCSTEPPGLFSCVVRPKDAKETQAVIQLANEAKFAIVPQTSGIHFNGDAVPKVGGVVLDLSRMNQITEIDEGNKVAHLEVGVTWEQFQATLAARGYRGVIPLLPHYSRSVITDWLELVVNTKEA
jgi:FAD/FMN-containing dehydrogenase